MQLRLGSAARAWATTGGKEGKYYNRYGRLRAQKECKKGRGRRKVVTWGEVRESGQTTGTPEDKGGAGATRGKREQ